MSVLYDVLNIAKEKRYMVLDPVSQDPPENKSAMHMVSKRKVNLFKSLFKLEKDSIQKMNEQS